MYLAASSKIARQYPALEAQVSNVDTFFRFRMGVAFDIDTALDHVGIEPALLGRIAALYVREEVLVEFDALLCPEHRQVLEKDDDGLFYCDLCDEIGYEDNQLVSARLLRLSDQALEEISRLLERPLEIMRQRRGDMIEILLALPTTNTFLGRTQLLDGIEHGGNLNRDENNQRVDLGLIVDQVTEMRPSERVKFPVLVLVGNALQHCADYEVGNRLRELRAQLGFEQ